MINPAEKLRGLLNFSTLAQSIIICRPSIPQTTYTAKKPQRKPKQIEWCIRTLKRLNTKWPHTTLARVVDRTRPTISGWGAGDKEIKRALNKRVYTALNANGHKCWDVESGTHLMPLLRLS